MKLRNKKTGEIAEPFGITCMNGRTFVQFDDGKGTFKFEARSLAELNAEWEDYEEPKEYCYMDYGGRIKAINDANDEEDLARKEIGNYFDTREDAELAVRKLKAWKRLEDKGFRFDKWDYAESSMYIRFHFDKQAWATETDPDLDLLFGGEE